MPSEFHNQPEAPARAPALYTTGFRDGRRYRRWGIGLPQELLNASDDYACGLRAGYGVTPTTAQILRHPRR